MHLLKALGKNAKKCFLKRENDLKVDLFFAFISTFDLLSRLRQKLSTTFVVLYFLCEGELKPKRVRRQKGKKFCELFFCFKTNDTILCISA